MKKFNSIFSKFKIIRGGRLFGFGTSPENDWKIILMTFMMLLVITLAACVYYFIKVDNGNFLVLTDEEKTPTSTFNLNRVRQTINYYEGKSEELEKIKNTPEDILDPSL
jgi:hypothetical protein